MSSQGKLLISLGSNCGNRVENIEKALQWLSGRMTYIVHSGIYETESISGDGKLYCNCVVQGMYSGDISELTRQSKVYEIECGRTSNARGRGEVPIDIDIVKYGQDILRPKEYEAHYFRLGLERL